MSEINNVNNTPLPFKDIAKFKIKDSIKIDLPIKPSHSSDVSSSLSKTIFNKAINKKNDYQNDSNSANPIKLTNSTADRPKLPTQSSYLAEDTPKIPIKPTISAADRPKIPLKIAERDPIEIKIEPKPRYGLNPTAGTMSEAATLTLNVKTIGELMRQEKDLRNLYVKNMYNEMLNNRFISRTFQKRDLSKQLSRQILGDGYIIRTMAETRAINLSEYKREHIIELKLEEKLEVNNSLKDSTRKYEQEFRNPINVKILEITKDNYKLNSEKNNEKLIREYGSDIIIKNIPDASRLDNNVDLKQSDNQDSSTWLEKNNTNISYKNLTPTISYEDLSSIEEISTQNIEKQKAEENAPILQVIPNFANEQAVSIATPYFVSFVYNNQSNFGTSVTINTSD
jgi:hypothetical protein